MATVRGMRPWIVARLSDKPEASIAEMTLKRWKQMRCCAGNLARAILLYADLLSGRTDRLNEWFPWTGNAQSSARRTGAYSVPTIEMIARTEQEQISEAAGDFFNGVEF